MVMDPIPEISAPQYQARVERYQQALDTLDSVSQPSTAQLLEILLARDALQAVPLNHRPPAETLMTLQFLDRRLEDHKSLFAQQVDTLQPLQQTLEIDPTAWWWPTPPKPKRPWWAQQDWLWSMGSIVFLSVSASLVLNTAARFWSGGIASAGTLPIVAQSVLTLIAGQGALTRSGQQAWQKFLKRQGISEDYWHEWSFGAAGAVFLCVAAIHGSLPSVATWYNDRGWTQYQNRQLGSALSNYQTALSLRPDYGDAQFHSGLVYEDLQQYDQAKASYQFVVESDRNEVPLDIWLSAHNNLARLYLLDGNNRDAAPLLIRAQQSVDADLSDTNAKIADVNYSLRKNLGWVRLNQQRYDEARVELEEAIIFDEEVLQVSPIKDELIEMSLQKETLTARAAAYCLLAQVADAQGQIADADNAWQQCLLNADSGDPDEDTWVGLYERRQLEETGNE